MILRWLGSHKALLTTIALASGAAALDAAKADPTLAKYATIAGLIVAALSGGVKPVK